MSFKTLMGIGLTFFVAGSAWGIPLKQYIPHFLKNSETLMSQRASTLTAEAQLKIAKDLWATKLLLIPSNSSMDQKFVPQAGGAEINYDNQRTLLNGEIDQSLPAGLNLSLEGFRTLSDSSSEFVGTETELKLNLSVDLWKNFLGTQDRQWIQSAEASYEAEKLKLENEILRQCHKAVEVYAEAASGLKLQELAAQKYESAEHAFKIAKRSFNQRLIRNLDLLSAEADFLTSQTQQRVQINETQTALDNLVIQGGEGVRETIKISEFSTLNLEIPEVSKPEQRLDSKAWRSGKQAQAAELLIASAEGVTRATEYANRSDIKAGVSLSHTEGVSQVGTPLYDKTDDAVQLFLRMEFPWDKTTSAKVAKARADEITAKAMQRQTLKELESKYLQVLRDSTTLRTNLSSSAARSVIFAKRMKRGLQLVRTGKIDYDEYIRYSTSFFDEKAHEIELQKNLIFTELKYLNITDQASPVCEEYL